MTGPLDTERTSQGRRSSLRGRLVRRGFVDTSRAQQLLADDDLVATLSLLPPETDVIDAFGLAADPDLALLNLVRLNAASRQAPQTLVKTLAQPGSCAQLLAVLGASTALGDELVRRPEAMSVFIDGSRGLDADGQEVRAELLAATGADPGALVPVAAINDDDGVQATEALRRAYRDQLLRIAAQDLTDPDPESRMPAVGAALADLAGAALEGAVAIARATCPGSEGVRLAVIGMGKCGARELNYVSDVDVIYVVEPVEGTSEHTALSVGARMATRLARVCSGVGAEPALWPVDAALRPEGKQGPLVRTLASHLAYYERWAKTWEFQALLKARPVAGDPELGAAYVRGVEPFVWSAAGRENFVEDAQAMRRRVEEHVSAAEADRQIKLGKGGLRDVEFTVQLLQLVHGRTDTSLHARDTLTALADLAASGYVGREHAAKLAACYRFLRALEHRIQLHRLRRTHLMPTDEGELAALARSLGMRSEGADGLVQRWRSTKRDVRALHEEIFYRPLLPATAQLSDEEISLAPDAARARFAAIGYRDPDGAMRHVTALTEGVSRRAAIQRQLLPVMLGWFAEGADPDAGLLAFRNLSEGLGRTHWYLKLLRDSGSAATRLAHLLANSKYMAEALARSPESVMWLADDADLAPRGAKRLAAEIDAILSRAGDSDSAATSLRAVRRRELARTGAAELLGVIQTEGAVEAISDAADAALVGALRIAEETVRDEFGIDLDGPAPASMLVVAMGRLGGREMGYGSDADVLFVHDGDPGAQSYALAVATRLRQLLQSLGSEPALPVDADLRPEGRNGPLVRSIDSYAEYYSRWSSVWESQALLRARPVAGPAELGERFVSLIDPLRYPAGGLDGAALREIRRIKARVESERLPRGVDPTRHLKLGRGGISDVEWLVQLLQLCHSHEVPALRTTSTTRALKVAMAQDIVTGDDGRTLLEAWELASRMRSGLVLWSGRTTGTSIDVLPHDRTALHGLATALRIPGASTGSQLEDLYLRTARRARTVMERLFYG